VLLDSKPAITECKHTLFCYIVIPNVRSMLQLRLLIIVLLLMVSDRSSAQPESSSDYLNRLDSLAFAALESNNPIATKKAFELLKAAEQSNSSIHKINAYTILGIVNKNRGYFVTAVNYYNDALKVAEKAGDQARISACYNNIGSVYQIQENYPQALLHFQQSLDIEEKLNNPLQKSIRLYNIGDIYRELDSLSLALNHFNSSLLIEKQFQNNEGIVYALLGISDVYLKLNKPVDAGISLDEAKKYLNETGIETQILFNLLNSELLISKNEFDGALASLQKAKKQSMDYDFRVYLMDIYENEIEAKEAKERFELESQRNLKKGSSEEKSNSWLWITLFLGSMSIVILFFLIRKL